ncbi:SCO2523 family variant P-loop protein [Streptomyces sp. NPDC086549]|uniref:SCO2523 family variant P-loop protein n=1 Tax=Streptomyces sp. NPDC086549 TaxID=3365752 RepID=UPI0037FDFAA7
MILFAASDKGGTGRSVTTANLAYRRALHGDDVCYVDFDFGSPTTAAVFDIPGAGLGIDGLGLHSYLRGHIAEPARIDVWAETEHSALRLRPAGSGRLLLLPGDQGGGEFAVDADALRRCADLLLLLSGEFDLVMVDLSAGRSFATDMVLAVTARPELRGLEARWLVYHRWTRQHVIAAAGLVHGSRGIVAAGVARGHDEQRLRDAVRFVRAAVPDPESPPWSHLTPTQSAWMRQCDQSLMALAAELGAGYARVLGSIPLEPVLQWREQLITDEDVLDSGIVTPQTRQAFEDLAGRLTDAESWGRA